MNGLEVAVALAYSPGSTPVVLCAEQGRRAERIVWAAQTLSLPILEIVQLDAEQLPLFEPGREIHESWYRIAAHALSMLYKSTPVPELVRFVRLVDGRGRPRSFATGAVEFEDVLGTPPVSVELGADLSQHVAELNETMEHMRQRVALETGLVLPPIPLKATAACRPSSPCGSRAWNRLWLRLASASDRCISLRTSATGSLRVVLASSTMSDFSLGRVRGRVSSGAEKSSALAGEMTISMART
ncbi:MAG: hypothetical protein EBS42_17020 [Caulobacteraceae bacterium]|nr:hypothetical protein [Caulobacteraceae bacterium]